LVLRSRSALGSLRALRSPVFPRPPCGSARPEPPYPPAVSLPFREFSRRSCSSPLDASTSPGHFRAVRRIRSDRVHTSRRSHAPGSFRVQGFSPSSRFAPRSAPRVYFTPLTFFGFTLQGFPLTESPDSSSLPACRRAVAPGAALSPPRLARPPAHLTLPLGWLRRCLGSTSRLCSLRESVPCGSRD